MYALFTIISLINFVFQLCLHFLVKNNDSQTQLKCFMNKIFILSLLCKNWIFKGPVSSSSNDVKNIELCREGRGVTPSTRIKLCSVGYRPWTRWPTFRGCRRAPCWAGVRPGCRQSCGRSELLWRCGSEAKQRKAQVQTGHKADRWRRMEWCSLGHFGDTCRKKKQKNLLGDL